MINKNTDKVHFVEVTEDMEGQRIDNFLLRYLTKVPKTHIYKILRKGEVRVNKKRTKPVYKLALNDLIRIPPVKTAEKKVHKISSALLKLVEDAIIFEDDNIMVLDKPSGLAVHGGSGINHGLIETLRHLYPSQSFLELVHRLDRDTSGCLLVAKRRQALIELQNQFRHRTTDKRYLALTCGSWKGSKLYVDQPLLKNTLKSGERMVTIDPEGKSSQSHFIPKTRFTKYCLLEVKIETGRTHQIRVHAQHIKHPIAGDEKYGSYACNQRLKQMGLQRLFLHAAQIQINLDFCGGGTRTFKAPLPDKLLKILEKLNE